MNSGPGDAPPPAGYDLAERFFNRVIGSARWLMPLMLILPVGFIWQLSTLQKDVRSDAFIAPDNPALRYREVIQERFGLNDPMLVAVIAEGEQGIFRSDVLAALQTLTDQLNALENISGEETLALASVSTIESEGDELQINPLLEEIPRSEEALQALRRRIDSFPLFRGSLVAEDGSATLIVLQLRDGSQSEATYRQLLTLVDNYALPPGVAVHVAGEGAVTGYLGAYVDADARILNPIAAVVILGAIAVSFRRWLPPLLAVLMIVASVSMSLGTMALAGIPFYVVTNAVPVILIGIAVADTIHVCNRFYLKQSMDPGTGARQHAVSTMVSLWRPISITSITTIAGFMGLYFASDMPPFRYFGLFTALGVLVAWVYSLLCLPCILCRATSAPQAATGAGSGTEDPRGSRAPSHGALGVAMTALGRAATARPGVTLFIYLCLALAGLFGVSQLRVDDDRVAIFDPSEKIAIANEAIKKHLGGTGTLDVVIETDTPEGLLAPAVLKAIDELQSHGESLAGVSGSRSIVDYLKQMNSVMADDGGYAVPESRELASQYMLLYSFSGDPADLAQLIDYEYQSANVRFSITPSDYQSFKPIVEDLQRFTAETFPGEAQATLSGRVSLDYNWLQAIGSSHGKSVLVTIAMVALISVISFRSLALGLLALLPVLASVLSVYAVMAVAGIPLGVGTSMFAAVAIGLGIDFAIHTIARLSPGRRRARMSQQHDRRERASDRRADFFSGTGRALALNVLAVAGGFAVLMISEISQLADFGLIVTTSVTVSFLASVTLIPAFYVLRDAGPRAA